LAAASEGIAERSERLTQVTGAGEAGAVLVLLSWDGKDCQEIELHCNRLACVQTRDQASGVTFN